MEEIAVRILIDGAYRRKAEDAGINFDDFLAGLLLDSLMRGSTLDRLVKGVGKGSIAAMSELKSITGLGKTVREIINSK